MQWKLAGAGLLALGTLVGTGAGAQAAGGCGPGFHPGIYGACRPNLYRPFHRPYGFYGPYAYRPALYGPRPWGWRRGWHRAGWGGPGWGWRHRW